MAKRAKGEDVKVEPAAAEPTVAAPADGDELTFVDFDVQLTELQHVEPDAESDDLDDLFTVTFSVDGPNANASVEVMVTDAADIEVVAVALDTLHGALVAWAETIQRRKAELKAILSEG